jgi:hypothetical protein
MADENRAPGTDQAKDSHRGEDLEYLLGHEEVEEHPGEHGDEHQDDRPGGHVPTVDGAEELRCIAIRDRL